MQALALRLKRWPRKQPGFFLPLAGGLWFFLYQSLIPVSQALVDALPVAQDSHLGGALQFFFYDTPKVLLLLTGMVFVMGIVHTFVSPERTRALLVGAAARRGQRHGGRIWASSRRSVPARRCRCSSAFCLPGCRWG